ncbi:MULTISPECIES: hypothetical protein [unclassified Aureispira]|uniref:hypothetical protein n=1 Tax=unclassified Aureispira TaxID=2649989 RepID=UPI0006992307|nr:MULTISPECIES: hypothetical protein [unclassified Aureispira]WMX14843.1 hypothetical protein QP953_00495 [Aureispira sp. CCB-E]
MKNTLIMPFLLFVAFALSGTLQAQDAKIKSVEFKSYERLPDQPKDSDLILTKKEIKEYDEKNRMIKLELHLANPIGELVKNKIRTQEWQQNFRTDEVATFDEMGDPILTTKSYISNKSKLTIKEEYTDYIKAPGHQYTKMFSYTSTGKPEKITLTNKDSRKVGEEVYKYNNDNEETYYKKWEVLPNGKKYMEIKKTAYTQEGFLASSEKMVKDGKDVYKDLITFQRNKVKEHLKFKNGEQISNFGGAKAGYDPSKARVLMEFGGGDSGGGGFGGFGLWTNEDEFDDKGNKIKTTQMAGEEITQIITYSYDKNSNLTETKKVSFHEGKETSSSKEVLEYDRHNNLLKKALYQDEKLISKYTYDYTYF